MPRAVSTSPRFFERLKTLKADGRFYADVCTAMKSIQAAPEDYDSVDPSADFVDAVRRKVPHGFRIIYEFDDANLVFLDIVRVPPLRFPGP